MSDLLSKFAKQKVMVPSPPPPPCLLCKGNYCMGGAGY